MGVPPSSSHSTHWSSVNGQKDRHTGEQAHTCTQVFLAQTPSPKFLLGGPCRQVHQQGCHSYWQLVHTLARIGPDDDMDLSLVIAWVVLPLSLFLVLCCVKTNRENIAVWPVECQRIPPDLVLSIPVLSLRVITALTAFSKLELRILWIRSSVTGTIDMIN